MKLQGPLERGEADTSLLNIPLRSHGGIAAGVQNLLLDMSSWQVPCHEMNGHRETSWSLGDEYYSISVNEQPAPSEYQLRSTLPKSGGLSHLEHGRILGILDSGGG